MINNNGKKLTYDTIWKHGMVLPLAAAAAVYAAPQAKADLINGGWDWSASSPSQIQGQLGIVNNNNGAVYDSYTLQLSSAMSQLYNANPTFQSTYGSVQNMANSLFTVSIFDDISGGEVNQNWTGTQQGGTFDANGNYTLSHFGIGYDRWKDTNTDPTLDTMLLQLTGNTPGYAFENNPNQQVLGGVGQAGIDQFNDNIYAIELVVPEPSTRIVAIDSKFTNWFGDATIGNPAINGVYTNQLAVPYGSTVTNSINLYVYDESDPKRRVRVIGGGNGDRTEWVIAAITADVTVVFGWSEQFLVVVTNGPGGSVEGESGWREAGATVSNRAMAASGCTFGGWENGPPDQASDNPLVFTVDQAYTNLLARFVLLPPVLGPVGLDEGFPSLGVPEFPAGFTVVVQRCEEDLIEGDWQTLGPLPSGATTWTDLTATGAWQRLYYRLKE
jgi:hypothetical protein